VVVLWLRHCAKSRTVLGSFPVSVTGFFSDISLSDHTIVLGLTQPLGKMSARDIPGGKGGRWVRVTASPPSCAECHGNLGPLTSWKHLGHTRPVTGLLYLFTFYSTYLVKSLCEIECGMTTFI